MKVRDEIQQFSTPEDRPILEWLFARYRWASQWSFVATFSPQCYGTEPYKVHRVWKPTVEGRAVYAQLSGTKCPAAGEWRGRNWYWHAAVWTASRVGSISMTPHDKDLDDRTARDWLESIGENCVHQSNI